MARTRFLSMMNLYGKQSLLTRATSPDFQKQKPADVRETNRSSPCRGVYCERGKFVNSDRSFRAGHVRRRTSRDGKKSTAIDVHTHRAPNIRYVTIYRPSRKTSIRFHNDTGLRLARPRCYRSTLVFKSSVPVGSRPSLYRALIHSIGHASLRHTFTPTIVV